MMTAKKAPKDDLTRPGKFSLEALLAGRLNPVKSHRVTIDPDTAAKIGRLREEKDSLKLAAEQVEGLTQSRRRIGQKDERAQRTRDIDAEIAELLPKLDGTWIEVQFRPMTALEQDDTRNAKLAGPARQSAFMWAICAQARNDGSESEDDWSSMTADEWAQFIEVIGIPQFQVLDKVFGEITYGRAVTPDFFAQPSRSHTTQAS